MSGRPECVPPEPRAIPCREEAVRLKSLTLERYRAFKDREVISLSPITILIGKNGSGKSVITRVPLLVARAISGSADSPLELEAGSVEHATSFQDFVNQRSSLPFSLGMTAGNDSRTIGFETTLRYVSERRALAIERFSLVADGHALLEAELSSPEQLTTETPTYNVITANGDPRTMTLQFTGLLAEYASLDTESAQSVERLYLDLRSALPMPSYLGPFREEPARYMRTPSQGIIDLGPRGERALELLADDSLRHGGELTRRVSEWFAKAMGHEIDVDVTGEQPHVRVAPLSAHFAADLAETGAGFAQSIPVVVQHFAYRAGRIKSPTLIVEQPELHLHPAAHGELADLIAGTTRANDSWMPAMSIVETHSEQFIMRIRRRVAEGRSPADVRVLSLDHHESISDEGEPIRSISFNESGDPDSWPVGVFEESFSDLAAMRRNLRDKAH
jgi:predicted ATPase